MTPPFLRRLRLSKAAEPVGKSKSRICGGEKKKKQERTIMNTMTFSHHIQHQSRPLTRSRLTAARMSSGQELAEVESR